MPAIFSGTTARSMVLMPKELSTLTNGTVVEAQRVLLATGFSTRRPGGEMVDKLVDLLAVVTCITPLRILTFAGTRVSTFRVRSPNLSWAPSQTRRCEASWRACEHFVRSIGR